MYKLFVEVDPPPTLPGGDAALIKYIASHLQYPAMVAGQGIDGICIVQFVVTKTGSVGEVKVVCSLGHDFDAEVVRVCKSLPKFTPGRKEGHVVNVWYTLPITF